MRDLKLFLLLELRAAIEVLLSGLIFVFCGSGTREIQEERSRWGITSHCNGHKTNNSNDDEIHHPMWM